MNREQLTKLYIKACEDGDFMLSMYARYALDYWLDVRYPDGRAIRAANMCERAIKASKTQIERYIVLFDIGDGEYEPSRDCPKVYITRAEAQEAIDSNPHRRVSPKTDWKVCKVIL